MKNLTLLCGKEYPCRKVFKKWMCGHTFWTVPIAADLVLRYWLIFSFIERGFNFGVGTCTWSLMEGTTWQTFQLFLVVNFTWSRNHITWFRDNQNHQFHVIFRDRDFTWWGTRFHRDEHYFRIFLHFCPIKEPVTKKIRLLQVLTMVL